MSTGYRYIDSYGSFEWEDAEQDLGLYFPIAGERGLKSSVSPNLGGDCKLDQNHFVLEPVSIENLRNNRSSRNFWCLIPGKRPWSAAGNSAEQECARFSDRQEKSLVRAGKMWHETDRENPGLGLKSRITSFVPVDGNVEVMAVTITNISEAELDVTGIAAVPIYGRSADNLRDHRHVTSLLHRIYASAYGVWVKPTLSFDERGHQKNEQIYFAEGVDGAQNPPKYLFPEAEGFLGSGGSWTHPEAIYRWEEKCHRAFTPCKMTEAEFLTAGQEALGGLVFQPVQLRSGESYTYTILIGSVLAEARKLILQERSRFFVAEGASRILQKTREYWREKAAVHVKTGDPDFDQFMEWVSFQPELRKIYGCSFLPHHDYGKGGRGWRDLWQDCLALLLTDPDSVKGLLLSNFGGVRFDGTNATIIGEKPGEFKADRNAITRVWSDHGIWPLITTKLYIDQTGDYKFLFRETTYFKDRQVKRGRAVDEKWNPEEKEQRDSRGFVVKGTVLEHLLVQQLTSYYEVGEHNNLLLRDADWNDALDLAGHQGETVAFTCALAMNLSHLANLLEYAAAKGTNRIRLHREVSWLLHDEDDTDDFAAAKQRVLEVFLQNCVHTISGEWEEIRTSEAVQILRTKADRIIKHVRKQEWITDSNGESWFNSYYDDYGRRVEGDGKMMLTGQVFAIMSGTATDSQTEQIIHAVDRYLYDPNCGGYRLNTDFGELRTDLGRMFGFAYGEKENGAVFSHMAVMYANALYSRGFAKAGYQALQSLYLQSTRTAVSRIYPGIPEYFGKDGRGLYHYLTGAASWYLMTVVNQVFGIRGAGGDLLLQPKLRREQFDSAHCAEIQIPFAGRMIRFCFRNAENLDVGEYAIAQVRWNDAVLTPDMWKASTGEGILIDRERITEHTDSSLSVCEIELRRKGR